MKKYLFVLIPLLSFVLILVVFDLIDAYRTEHIHVDQPNITKFWEYQCIDTMKSSRDMARAQLTDLVKANKDIEREVGLIADTGANCISIATPYDNEFLPVLQVWIWRAREHGLSIWFRGNFAGWEGWFDYPKDMSIDKHLELTRKFILENRLLFKSGDIFTGAPEAENGGPFAGNNNSSTLSKYLSFLASEYETEKIAFEDIGVSVTVNWFSMNGWIAKNMYTSEGLDAIGNTVTIDHYSKNLIDMEDYLKYFRDKFHSKIILGEFGAPIPDINGDMTESEQSLFVSDMMKLFYRYRGSVSGLNYWTLRFGTTRLINDDFTTRKVYETLRRFYNPGVIYGRVLNSLGQPLKNVRVQVSTYDTGTTTDSRGYYSIVLPAGSSSIDFIAEDGGALNTQIDLSSGERKEYPIKLKSAKAGFIEKIRGFYRSLVWKTL